MQPARQGVRSRAPRTSTYPSTSQTLLCPTASLNRNRRDSTTGARRRVVVSGTVGVQLRSSQIRAAADQTSQPPDQAETGAARRRGTCAAGHPRALGGADQVVDVGLHHEIVVLVIHVVLPLVVASTISAPRPQSTAETSAARSNPATGPPEPVAEPTVTTSATPAAPPR